MAALEGDIAEQAAEVHRSNKFDSGVKGPSADSSLTKLASGLAGTAEVQNLSCDPLASTSCFSAFFPNAMSCVALSWSKT